MSGLSGRWSRGGGLVVALVGFGVTRLFVAETIRMSGSPSFLLAGLLSLVVGLGLSVYGVLLVVGAFSRTYVATVTRWCLLGTGAMLVVLAVSSSDAMLAPEGLTVLSASPTLVANVLLGGGVAGVLVGSHSARNRLQRRELRRRGNQARLVNRVLRHEVINAAHVVGGHAQLLADESPGDDEASPTSSAVAIRDSVDRIVETVDEIGDITTEAGQGTPGDLAAALSAEVERLRDRYPDAGFTYDGPDHGVVLEGGDRLDLAYRKLLEHAVETSKADEICVTLSATDTDVTVTVTHDGQAFSEVQRALLADREFPEYDDPALGFRLQVARLLVSRAGGDVATTNDGDPGPTVTTRVPLDDRLPTVEGAVALARPALARTLVAGLLAGVVMGGYVGASSDTLVVIGALYGVENPLVGWTVHLFHSVVFAVLFAAGCTHERLQRVVGDTTWSGLAGVAWGAMLWLVAAGVVMPLWLRVVGVPAMVPNLSPLGLVSHLLWGGVLGVSYALLERVPVPGGQ